MRSPHQGKPSSRSNEVARSPSIRDVSTDERAGLADALSRAVPGVRILIDPEVLESYRFDQAQLVEAGIPLAVALPRSTDEVQALVRFAFEHRVPIVPRGAGSGLSGGANAINGCIVLSMTAMNHILAIDAIDQTATIQPGVITADLKRAVTDQGLHYPPDPASYAFSTMGGNVATNAGGLCCVKYGVTGDFVLGLELVMGDGTVLRTGRRTRKGAAGYDLTRLFVGSEGTLGIITEATVRLRPPTSPALTLVAAFPHLDPAGEAIAQVVSTLVPSMLEFLDRTTLNAIEDWKPVGLDREAEALLIAQSDGADADGDLRLIEDICRRAGASMVVRASTPAEADMLLEARRLAFPALERLGRVLLDDVAVPPSKIPALLHTINKIAQSTSLLIGTFGHAGDGNLHPTIVFDAHDPDVLPRVREAFGDIVRAALRLGGTVTGEHGVGILKREYLHAELGDRSLTVHAAIKQALDPRGILNPGKAF